MSVTLPEHAALPRVEHDLGPLAWVREELRKTMEAATKALRRYLREADAAALSNSPVTPDLAHLTQAAQLLHQCTGALAMIEQPAAAHMLRAMEAATQGFAEHPDTCTDEALTRIERASYAINDFLDAVLAGKPVSAVSLFPQYRDVQSLAGSERIHPADLWTPSWHWAAPPPGDAAPQTLEPAVRSRFDQAVLKIIKSGDTAAAHDVHALSLGLAAGTEDGPQRAFWSLAAGYFQAVSLGLVPSDLYAKRMASRVLTQYAALARGESLPSERLAQDLLFYCARAVPPAGAQAQALAAVRAAHGVEHAEAVDYEDRRFGRFDPVQLAQARKRVSTASETWSALAGGDTHQLKPALEQFHALGESLTRLHPDSAVLTQALQRAVAATVQGGTAPSAALAMEVATAVLYLEAAYTELDEDDAGMRARAGELAQRLDLVTEGGEPAALQLWMEELYRRVSDRQTMGSVVQELHKNLADIEQTLDQFFRAPREKLVLGKVVAQFTQMRGVLSVLGLEHASHAVLRMRETVDGYMADTLDDAHMRAANFDRLGSSLGALGLLIDMLGYQRAMARQLFVYDEEEGMLRLVVGGRAATPTREPLAAFAASAPDQQDQEAPQDTQADDIAAEDDDATAQGIDEHVREVGTLRIGLPLYNTYLNEADECSRRLLTELGEWALELPLPPQDSTVALAHALADSSATVGFTALSELARTLHTVLVQVQAQGLPDDQARVLLDAAEDMRRLLHQFAAGFLKEPDAAIQQALLGLLQALETQQAATTGSAFDEEIDVRDAIDPDLFPVFEEEASELLPRLSAALRQWGAQPEDQDARATARRALHTLKGSARLAGALRLGERAHRLESAMEPLGGDGVGAAQIEPLLAHCAVLQADMDMLRALHQPAPDDDALALEPEAQDGSEHAPQIPVPQVLVPRPMASHSVRVRSQLLDRLINQSGEVLITRARMEARLDQLRGALGDLSGNLDRLRRHLREIEVQADSQMQSRLAQSRDATQTFDPLEFDRFTRVQELTRMMAESVNDVATVQRSLQRSIEGTEDDLAAQGRQARELQRDLLRTRMVAFDAIAERLYGVVRQAATQLERQVQLDISGGVAELDRGVLDRIAPAFEHLLRNAIVHGIEDEATRSAAGKPAIGQLRIDVQHEANDIAIRVRDDGRGLDLPRIQAQALSLGLLSSGALLSAGEAADLIFLPGFSTTQQVTELAGRGIGMDVVRTEVQALGGRIETSTTSGQGTEFKIVLPLTTAVTQVVMLRAGPQRVGVPTNLIEAVRRVPAAELAQAYQSETFVEDGEALPFYWAGALLQSAAVSEGPSERHASVLVLRSASQRLALHVDEVLGKQEVVVKNLGPQLSRLPGLAGISVLAAGAVVLIYNPVALAAVYGAQARQAQHDRALRSGDGGLATLVQEAPTPLVLVVDDSITVRRVTQRLLQREGYRVALAADGQQALEMLQGEPPAIVLSDIEMPRMDGFELARQIRADPLLNALPIVMITSRMAEKHREHALALGVNHYLGKPYSEEELLSLVRRYTSVQAGD